MRLKLCLVFLCCIVLNYSSAQELTIYTMPAPRGVNWKSPRTLVLSYINNAICYSPYKGSKRHPIGHVIIELKDESKYALVGSTATSNRYMIHKIMHRGWGVGLLFATVNGTIEEADVNTPQLAIRTENGDIAFVHYKINREVFDRLWLYLQEYKERGYGKYYNGKNNPRKGAGAGCSAFAYSFIEIGGLDKLLDESRWQVHVAVQEGLIGGPESDDRRVSLFRLFTRGKWANPHRRHRQLSIYEPTFMYKWILNEWSKLPDTGKIHRGMHSKAKGIIIDAMDIHPPQEPIWLSDTLQKI